MASKSLPVHISSYDLLKSFAVLTMLADHLGCYFFPDDLWWRAIGRMSAPVWFFLAGYSSGRADYVRFLGGGAFLVAVNMVTGLSILPLNALVTIALLRLLTAPFVETVLRDRRSLWPLSVVLLFLVFPSFPFVEYGTSAFLISIFGYMARHRQEIGDEKLILRYMFFSLVAFALLQKIFFGFPMTLFLFMSAGLTLVWIILYQFRSKTYPELTAHCPGVLKGTLQFMGHRTLEIYVVHLTLFKFVALFLGQAGFEWFRFSLFPF